MGRRVDPVTAYAQQVRDGAIVASRLVRLACDRHLHDLETQAERGLEWRPGSAQEVIDFFPEVLCLPDVMSGADGKPFELSPFQQFIAGSLFGWYRTDGYRRFHHAYIETAKGSGKTPFGAGLLIYMAVADGERGAQCYCAAVTKDQAKLAFTDAENMVKVSPGLNRLFDKTVNNLAILDTGCFIRPISAEKRGLDGKRVHGALIDELHEHPKHEVSSKITAGTKDRKNALVLEITNSGFDRETVCWEHHDVSRQILEGAIVNDAWFAFVCHLDSCDACFETTGVYQPSDECLECDDWKTEGDHWLKANPNLGVSLQWQYLRNQVQRGIDLPSERNMVRRLNFCQWTQQRDVWIPAEAFAVCKGPISSASLMGRECYVGIDLSGKIDLSAVVFIFPRPIDTDDRPADSPSLDRAIDVLPYFWMPRNTLVRRSQEDNVPYVQWEKDGFITATPGDIIDHDAIVEFIIAASKKYRIKHIGFDQAGATAAVTRLRRQFGDDLVTEIPQSFRHLSEPSKTVEALIVSRNLVHDGNPVMQMCVGNMAIEENHWREIRPIKISQRKRIDGGVALIDAEAAMLATEFEPENVYLTRGVVQLGA